MEDYFFGEGGDYGGAALDVADVLGLPFNLRERNRLGSLAVLEREIWIFQMEDVELVIEIWGGGREEEEVLCDGEGGAIGRNQLLVHVEVPVWRLSKGSFLA